MQASVHEHLAARMSAETNSSPLWRDLAQVLAHLQPRRKWQLLGVAALMILGAVAEVASLGAVVPFLALLADPSVATRNLVLGSVIERLRPWVGSDLVAGAAGLFVVFAVAAATIRLALARTSQRLIFSIGAEIGTDVYRRTLHQPYSTHVLRNSSEILAGITKVHLLVEGVLNPALQGAVSVLISLAIVGMLIAIDPFIALLAGGCFSALYLATTVVTRGKLAKNGSVIAGNENKKVQAIQEGLGAIRDIIIESNHDVYVARFSRLDREQRTAQANVAFLSVAPKYVIEALGMIFIVLIALATTRPGASGLSSTLPVLGALAIGAQKMLPHLQQVYQGWSHVNGNRTAMRHVLRLLEQPMPLELGVPSMLLKRGTVRGNEPLISLRHVGFRYAATDAPALNDVNLEIREGTCVGIVGRTGSGKTTLIDLILGLLAPTGGDLLVRGQALTDANRREWQSEIAHVPQHIYLADASIGENIAFGVPLHQIDWVRLRESARTAQLLAFVEGLPQQFDTAVGERGVRLSGGQRQRIGLARALYKNASVLVLDEATSALDEKTESAVLSALAESAPSKTILMITHRKSTLHMCDCLIHIEHGTARCEAGHAGPVHVAVAGRAGF